MTEAFELVILILWEEKSNNPFQKKIAEFWKIIFASITLGLYLH